jgi:uncharacterized iron-regulated protein
VRDILTGSPALPSIAAVVGLAVAAMTTNGGCTASRTPREVVSAPEWKSPIARDHVLAGKVYAVGRGWQIDLDDLARVLERSDFVLLGEQHDNADHHRIQADLLASLVAAGRRPAVAFEQIDLEHQAAVDKVLDTSPWPNDAEVEKLATRVAKAAAWEKSGWPPFQTYRPVFETAIGAGLPIRAANLSRSAMNDVFAASSTPKKGRGEVVALRDSGLLAEVPLPDAARLSMSADIEDSHCGYASDAMVEKMVEAQRRRDAVMADALAVADSRGAWKGAVLIAGAGHVRKDFGVPLYLRRLMPNRSIVSVAMLEVVPGTVDPAAYAELLHSAELPFDYVVFTPRADDKDPCEKFRANLEKMKKKR